LEPVKFHPSLATVSAVIMMGVLATAVAFTIQTWAQKYTTATRTALIFALEPVCALATSYVFETDLPSVWPVTGAACILAGILVVELKPMQVASHP
jgi:drug/metabolite transporter (DMT)-like permease